MKTTKTPSEAEIIIQKIPSDSGIHRNPRKGTLNSPEILLEAFEPEQKVLLDEVFPNEFNLEETHRRIENNTKDLLQYNKPILSIGGDHSISYPVIKKIKEKYPKLELVWLDSHLDLKEKVNGHVSHDVVVRELLGTGFEEDEIHIVGVTKADEDEEKFLEDSNLNIYRAGEIEKFQREFDSGEQPVYLSADIDALTDKEAPGTGYPDGELSINQVKDIISKVEPDHADLVEVAPPFDKQGKTVSSGQKILEKLSQELTK